MRVLAATLLIMLSATAASSETWISREGECLEWSGVWDIERGRSGLWSGYVEFMDVGSECGVGRGARVAGEVTAAIVGLTFFAARQSGPADQLCTYFGRVRGDRVTGYELCEGSGRRIPFALRLQAAERYGPRRGGTFGDDWLDSLR